MAGRQRYSPLWELTRARNLDTLRQPEAMFWVFAFPLLLALALGFAFRSKGPDRIPVGVVRGPASAVTAALEQSPTLRVRTYSEAEGRRALRTGKISLLVEWNDGPVFRFDPTRPDSRTARLEASDAIQTAAGRRDRVPIGLQPVEEKGSRYIDFLIPGLLGMNLMGTGMWSVGFSIATARTQNLIKRLVATPMRKSDYLLSHMVSRLFFLALEVVVLVSFGWIVFDVGVHGSILLLAFICLLGALTFSGLGLLVASRARTIEGVSGLLNVVMIPMWILSGIFFSSERFPDVTQPLIRALPLTALNDALRAVMIDGKPLAQISSEIVVLIAWGLVSFLLALRIFRWQ